MQGPCGCRGARGPVAHEGARSGKAACPEWLAVGGRGPVLRSRAASLREAVGDGRGCRYEDRSEAVVDKKKKII